MDKTIKKYGWLKCMMCGRHPQTQAGVITVISLPAKCSECGGNLYVEDISVVTTFHRNDDDIDYDEDKPRRGRPPKALQEQHRKEMEELDDDRRPFGRSSMSRSYS